MKHRNELNDMSLIELKDLYMEEILELHNLLVKGIKWEDTEHQRIFLNAIGFIIDSKAGNFSIIHTSVTNLKVVQ